MKTFILAVCMCLIGVVQAQYQTFPAGEPQFTTGKSGLEYDVGISTKLFIDTDASYPTSGWNGPSSACNAILELSVGYYIDRGDYYCIQGVCSTDASDYEMLATVNPTVGDFYQCFAYQNRDQTGEVYVGSAFYADKPVETCSFGTELGGSVTIERNFTAKCEGTCWKDKLVLFGDSAKWSGDPTWVQNQGPDGKWDSQRKVKDCVYDASVNKMRCEVTVDKASFQDALGQDYGNIVQFMTMTKQGKRKGPIDCINFDL